MIDLIGLKVSKGKSHTEDIGMSSGRTIEANQSCLGLGDHLWPDQQHVRLSHLLCSVRSSLPGDT